jgi:hypothetical protein
MLLIVCMHAYAGFASVITLEHAHFMLVGHAPATTSTSTDVTPLGAVQV